MSCRLAHFCLPPMTASSCCISDGWRYTCPEDIEPRKREATNTGRTTRPRTPNTCMTPSTEKKIEQLVKASPLADQPRREEVIDDPHENSRDQGISRDRMPEIASKTAAGAQARNARPSETSKTYITTPRAGEGVRAPSTPWIAEITAMPITLAVIELERCGL